MKAIIPLKNGEYRTVGGFEVDIEGDKGFLVHSSVSRPGAFTVTDIHTGLWVFLGKPGQSVLEVIDGAKDAIEENGGIEEHVAQRNLGIRPS